MQNPGKVENLLTRWMREIKIRLGEEEARENESRLDAKFIAECFLLSIAYTPFSKMKPRIVSDIREMYENEFNSSNITAKEELAFGFIQDNVRVSIEKNEIKIEDGNIFLG